METQHIASLHYEPTGTNRPFLRIHIFFHTMNKQPHLRALHASERNLSRERESRLHELAVVDTPVDPLPMQKVIMRPHLHHLTSIQHNDLVRIHDRA